MSYRRYALVLDDDDGSLGAISLRLLRMGVDAVYANHPDEALLLARQESGRVGAILVPSTTPIDDLREVLKKVGSRAAVGPSTLLLVGARPEDSQRIALREMGVRWSLWEPFGDTALRFVVAATLSWEHDEEARMDLRAPTSLEAVVRERTEELKLRVHDLSVGGVYLETASPLPEGTEISIELLLPTAPLAAQGRVIHAKSASDAGRMDRPQGMGVVFTNLDFSFQSEVRRLVEEQLRRFEV